MFTYKDYIYAVYKESSFSKAAQRLYISQSSLSTTIKRAEEKIGLPIFDRTTYPIQLTEFGELYIDAVEQVDVLTETLSNYIYDVNHMAKGTLSIGTGSFFARSLLPPVISAFKKRYPQVNIELIEGRTLDLEHQLMKGRINLLFTNGQLDEDLFDKTLLLTERLLFVVPKSLQSAQIQSEALVPEEALYRKEYDSIPGVDLRDFKELPFIGLRPGNDTRNRIDTIMQSFEIAPNFLLELDQSATCFSLVSSGIGAGLVADNIIQSGGNLSRFLIYKIDHPATLRDISVYTKHTGILSKASREFIKIMVSSLSRPRPHKNT